jgi:enamidase
MSATAAIVNAGAVVTGRIDEGPVEADAVLMADGRITGVGSASDLGASEADVVVDAAGAIIAPGLIDSHCHVVIGDYTPRQKTVDFLESYVHGGITTCISASEVHAPGRPRDPVGVKALAVAAQRCFSAYRPGGMTVHAGSVILEPGLVEADFAELASQGVWLAKAGFGAFERPADCAPLVHAAQANGLVVMCHTGGASIPSSSPVTADDLLAMLPDVSGHVNGGPTALSTEDLERVLDEPRIALQVVQAGNQRAALAVARGLVARDALDRLLIASDTPTGTGTMPLGVLKSVVELSSLGGLEPAAAIAAATGNVGHAYRIDAGVLEPGRPADLMVLDAPLGSATTDALDAIAWGDIPAVCCVFTRGELRFTTSRNTPPPTRDVRVVGAVAGARV